MRLSALRVLVSYFKPGGFVSLEVLEDPPSGSGAEGPCCIGHETDFYARSGARPLGAGTRDRILAAVQALAGADADSQVRRAAAFVASGLAFIVLGERTPQ